MWRLLKAIGRFFSFAWLRGSERVREAADNQFTGSAQGISDAFEIQRDKWVNDYQELRKAVAEVEMVTESNRDRLTALNKEEEEMIRRRDGALALADQAKEANDTDAYNRHAAAFERYDSRIAEIDAKQAELEGEVKEQEEAMKKYMFRLTEFQAEIQRLPQQKAEAIADFVSSQKIKELNDRLLNVQSSMDRGPIDTVLNRVKQLKAEAKISEKLAGTDVALQDEEYARQGREAGARSRLDQILAARKAEREAKTGAADPTVTRERPQI